MSANVIEIPKPKRTKATYGQGSIRQHGTRWQISFYDDNGRRRWKSFTTEKKAIKALATMTTLRDAGKLDEAETKISIDKLAELYLADRKGGAPKSYSWLKSLWDLHLEPFFGGWVAARLTTDHFVEYRNERLAAKASPTTINKELTILRAMFNYGASLTPPKVRNIPTFPKRLKEPPPRKGFLTDEQFDALIANCPYQPLRALWTTAYTFGFRRAELVGRKQRHQEPMKVRQIDMKARSIDLDPGTTKNDDARVVRMTQEVCDALKPCVEGKRPDDFVFTWPNGAPILDFRGAWAKAIKAAGLPSDLRLHDFRRAAVRNLDRAGVGQSRAMRITGHRTDSVYRRYNITSDADLAEVAAKLDARRIGGNLVPTSEQKS